MHIKTALFSVFTGTLLLRHMVLAGGLCSQFDSDILSLNVPPRRRTDSKGDKLFDVDSFAREHIALTLRVADLRCLLFCKTCERLTRNNGC